MDVWYAQVAYTYKSIYSISRLNAICKRLHRIQKKKKMKFEITIFSKIKFVKLDVYENAYIIIHV